MNMETFFSVFPGLMEGAWLTVQLVGIAVLIGFAIALPVALLRVSENPLVRAGPYAYIFFFRGTPLLVQIFLVYYGLSQFEAVRDSFLWPVLREAYWCAIIAFSLNTAAYSAEILRGAIQAVPWGEVEAARAVGMSRALTYRRIILPRAFRICLPAYGNEVILMVKSSALASTITLLDLTGMARKIIAVNYQPVETFAAAGVIYLVMIFLFATFLRWLEKRLHANLSPPPGMPN
ncbi:polar amino acid ABC transporter, inner membrane subunit [Caenispirillum salinarum AK4]|uniref:Polar amino acid ABC transporter, inner membrane subunit n=1 Tax=Caenispirillum salinarum AK4 TaxID=1238182 RepID=K9GSK4_9PROT|nr:ABC transporter permease [Caenispirillum salinarum]EKV28127.1 polar amino acid ABC transporter, inner membrane subunit [Caenispirillum salinarum AK4]